VKHRLLVFPEIGLVVLLGWVFLWRSDLEIGTIVIGVLVILGGVVIVSLVWPPGGPWLPTSKKRVRKMLEMAEVKSGEIVYDLGSGDGRVLIMAAREFGAQGVGIEIDLLRSWWSKLRVKALGLEDQVQVIRGDMFKQDFSQADVVFVYLLQKTINQLTRKLVKELRPGTRVVSNTFIFPGLPPVINNKKEQLYLYVIKKAD
jgi:predicted RNA methylase